MVQHRLCRGRHRCELTHPDSKRSVLQWAPVRSPDWGPYLWRCADVAVTTTAYSTLTAIPMTFLCHRSGRAWSARRAVLSVPTRGLIGMSAHRQVCSAQTPTKVRFTLKNGHSVAREACPHLVIRDAPVRFAGTKFGWTLAPMSASSVAMHRRWEVVSAVGATADGSLVCKRR